MYLLWLCSAQEWSELDIKGELPVPRDSHAACCLNFGDDHPQLLVTGGMDSHNKVLGDTWILDVHARTWRKVNFIAIYSLNQYPLDHSERVYTCTQVYQTALFFYSEH